MPFSCLFYLKETLSVTKSLESGRFFIIKDLKNIFKIACHPVVACPHSSYVYMREDSRGEDIQ